jgi:spectinomycin phosphotransferase
VGRREREAQLFHRGYGPFEPEQNALAYYRYHRIVEDVAVTCEQLLATREGGANRAQVLGYVVAAFRPGHSVDVARRMDSV